MTHQSDESIMKEISEVLISNGLTGTSQVMTTVLNEVMKLERSDALKAKLYERTKERQGHANGYKGKRVMTRFGELRVEVPQTRDCSFYPQSLEKGLRSERALGLAVTEMYVKGVSTRKVKDVVQELCGLDISSSQVSVLSQRLDEELTEFRNRPLGEVAYVFLDARYEKIRHGGHVIDMSVLIAIGINSQGKREVLGVSTSLSEAMTHWKFFLDSLVARGLSGVQLIISDDHVGLKAAKQSIFPTIPWQRCQFHMSQNAQSYAPRKALKTDIAVAMRDIFNSPNIESARQQAVFTVMKFQEIAPHFSKWLENNVEEGLTVFQFPRPHWKHIRTVNSLERLNQEIKRRTRVARIFPNEASCLRLVTALLVEVHDQWITGRIILNMENLHSLDQIPLVINF